MQQRLRHIVGQGGGGHQIGVGPARDQLRVDRPAIRRRLAITRSYCRPGRCTLDRMKPPLPSLAM
jgi:hypothetical protein